MNNKRNSSKQIDASLNDKMELNHVQFYIDRNIDYFQTILTKMGHPTLFPENLLNTQSNQPALIILDTLKTQTMTKIEKQKNNKDKDTNLALKLSKTRDIKIVPFKHGDKNYELFQSELKNRFYFQNFSDKEKFIITRNTLQQYALEWT
jgi:hypothetical protein